MFVTGSEAGLSSANAIPSPLQAVAWKEIAEPLQPFLAKVTQRLSEQIEAFDPEIVPYTQYALTNQGKQLRPVLVGLSGLAAGKLNDSLVTVAVIIEMVHLATLVHDDVMDQAEVRRRRPTLAANWGNEISVLVGDCLFSHAVTLAAGFPTPEVCRVVASATNAVCSGEILQTHQRRKLTLSRAEYYKAVQMKTGELFGLSCDLGAALGGGTPAVRLALRKFGLNLGTAYQVYDDCLDVFGSEVAAGKSLGTDLESGKMTLPLLIAYEKADLSERKWLSKVINKWDAEHFSKVLEILDRKEALPDSKLVIREHLEMARTELAAAKLNQAGNPLLGLTAFLAQQTDALGVNS